MSLKAYSLRKREKQKETEENMKTDDDYKLFAELQKIAVSPKLAKEWLEDPCARPC